MLNTKFLRLLFFEDYCPDPTAVQILHAQWESKVKYTVSFDNPFVTPIRPIKTKAE